MRPRWSPVVVVGLAGACATTARPAPVAPTAVAPAPSASPSAPTPRGPVEIDRGELTLTIRGRPAGAEVFTIEADPDGYVIRSEVRLESGSTLRLFDSVLTTDRAWRPRAATGRDVKDGGTTVALTGAPLVLRTRSQLGPSSERTASRAVELYLGDNTFAHFAPACALPAPTVRVGFPGMDVRIGVDQPTALAGVTRRTVDLAGTMRAVVTCEAGRLLAVELPTMALTAIRTDRTDDVTPLVLPTPTKAALAPGLIELERTIARPDATLACALVVPAAATAPLPVAVLLTGSGAQDRDSDSTGPGGIKLGLLRAVASALGLAGVATLRCDDRGVGGSSGDFGAATVDTFIDDARAMVAAVRADRRLDPARVALIGHSEGAVVAAAVAAVEPRVAAVALLAGPGRPVEQVLLEQVALTLSRAGLTAAEAEAALDRHRAAFVAIRAGAPLPDTPEAAEWRGGERWLRSHMTRDILATIAALGSRPLLVAQGGVDQQVAAVDADALVAAARAAGNPAVVDRRYPGLDHLFAASATGDPAAYADPDRQVDPRFLTDLAAFVAAAPARRR
ncbi:MAG: alpha/beta hydrolase [Myxococcales bacterium]|nr:alpha/beta hydrolase [Myxococcales bacterium]